MSFQVGESQSSSSKCHHEWSQRPTFHLYASQFGRRTSAYVVPFFQINTLLLGQHHAEEIFRAHIEKFGVHVELGSTLVDFEQDSVGVTAHIVKKSGDFESREVIRTPFLIGTDGSRGIPIFLNL